MVRRIRFERIANSRSNRRKQELSLGNAIRSWFNDIVNIVGRADTRLVSQDTMDSLFATIKQLVSDERYLIGEHALERLDERGVMEWQVVAGLESSRLIVERPDASPNPAIEVRTTLPDGTDVKAVWSLLRKSGAAKLVTVHFFDR